MFNRRDFGYTLVSRFEESFRNFLNKKLSANFLDFKEYIPNGIIDKVKEKCIFGDVTCIEDFLDNIDFPDLKEIVCFNHSYSNYLDSETISQEDFSLIMDQLYNIRNKIAHIKRTFTSLDLDMLIELTSKISDNLNAFGHEYKNFLLEIQRNPEKIIISIPSEFYSNEIEEKIVPNNVPTPDYEYEGGFVGRQDDIKKVIGLLDEDRHRVITISGAGGVGKTALALKIVEILLQNSQNRFDGIVWLSAKETKLSYLGIEDIEPTIKSYEELLDTISEVMGFGKTSDKIEEKEEHVNTIFELHNCILIVIDNLETISDERIINFILDSHPKIKVLVTSRKGLGQVERRIELKQLKEKEAIYLFRLVARDKNLNDLATLDESIIKKYVKKVAYYPLAIKWVLGQIAIGKNINDIVDSINETTNDISLFCFEQIFSQLSETSKKILFALSYFDESPSAGVLKYVANINQNDFDDGIRDLILLSLVVPEQYKNESNELLSKYSLLSLTHGYVRHQLDRDHILKRDFEERLRTIQNNTEEAERAKVQYRFSLANLGANTEEEKIAAMLVQTAFQKYQAGRYIEAVSDYKRAREIAPRFSSVYRNWAVMESTEGHYVEADKLMEKASDLNPDDTQIWLTWGNMKRKNDKIKEALEKYNKAFSLSPDDYVVLNALGQAKCRLGEYKEADTLFRRALKAESTGSQRKHEIINLSSMAENLLRWSDSLIKDRDYDEAENKLKEAQGYCFNAVKLDRNDPKSNGLLRKTHLDLGYLYKDFKRLPKLAIEQFSKVIAENPKRYIEAKDTILAVVQLTKLYFSVGEIEDAKNIYSPKMKRIAKFLKNDPKLTERFNSYYEELFGDLKKCYGKIIRIELERGFVIIESDASPGDTYLGEFIDFYGNQFEIPVKVKFGDRVYFSPYISPDIDKKDKKAKFIRIISESL